MTNRLLIIIALLVLTKCSDNKAVDAKIDSQSITIKTIKYFDFKFAKVVAFATVSPFDYTDFYFAKIVDFSKFHDTICKSLDNNQINYLGTVLSGKLNKDTTTIRYIGDCFYPRHNIVFLNDKDSVINYISVCFECNRVKASKYGNASMDNFKEFFNSVGLKVFDRPDYYKTYYDSINKLRAKR